MEDADEIRDEQSSFARADTHGELVAEEARCRFAEAGQAHVLAQCGGDLHVELVERDDAVDLPRAREIHHGIDDLRGAHLLRHGVDLR